MYRFIYFPLPFLNFLNLAERPLSVSFPPTSSRCSSSAFSSVFHNIHYSSFKKQKKIPSALMEVGPSCLRKARNFRELCAHTSVAMFIIYSVCSRLSPCPGLLSSCNYFCLFFTIVFKIQNTLSSGDTTEASWAHWETQITAVYFAHQPVKLLEN